MTETRLEEALLELPPLPEETFAELLAFGGLDEKAKRAMRLEAERLLEGAAAFVAGVYDHLSRHPGTAKALGWEGRVPEEELYVRRAFFGAWLARTIGVDTSAEFAREVYRAGLWHGGLGPKRAHIPRSTWACPSPWWPATWRKGWGTCGPGWSTSRPRRRSCARATRRPWP